MIGDLSLQNRQRARNIDLLLLRRIIKTLLLDLLPPIDFELGIHLIATAEMTRLNEAFLHHAGSTDVITFDHTKAVAQDSPSVTKGQSRVVGGRAPTPLKLQGEIFISLDEALAQSRKYRTSWQSELIRYLVHGVLHLNGFDDSLSADRAKMKREEDRLLCELNRRFALSKLDRKPRVSA